MEHSLQDYGAFPRHDLPAFRPLRSTGDALALVAAMVRAVPRSVVRAAKRLLTRQRGRGDCESASCVPMQTAFIAYILVSRFIPHSKPWLLSPAHEASTHVVLFLVVRAQLAATAVGS